MVDRPLVARHVATVRDAVARIRDVLPPSLEAFEADRTAREVVILNLFVAVQACLDLATHWLADEGWEVPQRYGEIFRALADHVATGSGPSDRQATVTGLWPGHLCACDSRGRISATGAASRRSWRRRRWP